MSTIYTLENLWNFTDNQIKQILQYFGSQILNSSNDRLNAIILSFNNNILSPEDRSYVMSPEFNKLFLATQQQLQILAQERGLTELRSHIGMIKYIIDNLNTQIIPLVSTIPVTTQPIGLYQMANNLYLCGSGTFNLREQLKTLGGTWNANIKCWSFPLSSREQLLPFISSSSPSISPSAIPQIPIINQVPKNIPGNLGIYQFNNQVIVCGKQTYNLQDKLKALNGNFDRNVGCWVLPLQQAQAALDLYNQSVRENYLEAERIQAQRQATRQENIIKGQQRAQEEAERQIRLQTPEVEAPYIRHINRLPKEYIDQITTSRSIWNNEYSNLNYQMQRKDIDELRPLWDDKIQIIKYTSPGLSAYRTQAIVTYTGDIKPPNAAMEYKVNGWDYIPFGASVRRIDYKKYDVYVSGTD